MSKRKWWGMKPIGRGIASSIFSGIDEMFHGSAKQAQVTRHEQKHRVVDIGNSDDLNKITIRLPKIGSEMKSMTCNQLGGACEQIFSGETFDELASQSQQHGKEMFEVNDGPHMAAMGKMMELMKSGEMDSWMSARKAEFEAL